MVSEKKKKIVQELTKLVQAYPVIALANLENLPAQQLQNMRAKLRGQQIVLIMSRKRLLILALKNSQKPHISKLIQKITGMPALLLSKENPFTLYSILQKNKSSAPAKPHQLAPRDIIVPAGPTNFAPGPIISELAGVGIKTKVEGGKLAIIQDTTVAKEGDIISPKLAETLKRLDIRPMEIGLELVAAWENELVFDGKQLRIDEAEYFNNLILAHQEAFNLAVGAAYLTEDTIELLLQKAFHESKTLAAEQNILTDLTAGELLAKAELQAESLKDIANLEIPEKPKEELPKTEELKEEPKTEESTPEEKPAKESQPEPRPEPAGKKKPEPEENKAEEPQPEPEKKEAEKEEKKEQPPAQPEKDVPTTVGNEVSEAQGKDFPSTVGNEVSEAQGKDFPSAEELIEKTKEKFREETKEKPEEVVEEIPRAEEMIAQTQEQFSPGYKKPEQPSAIDLVEEEKQQAQQETPKEDKDIKEAENLYEQLKKKGTLRGEK